jgi:hypothetical protein
MAFALDILGDRWTLVVQRGSGFARRAAREREAVVAEIRAAHRHVDPAPPRRRRKPEEPRRAP